MPRYYSDLTTREDVRTQLMRGDLDGTDPTPVNSEDADFVTYVDSTIHSLSRYITDTTGRVFIPYKDTKSYRLRTVRHNGQWAVIDGEWGLMLPEEFIVLSSVTWNSELLSANRYYESPENNLPYSAIVFDSDNLPSWSDTFTAAIDIDAIWGFHTNLAEAWQASTTDTNITINSSVSTITVAAASAYKTWQYIRIEDEYLQITARNESTQVLTVKRGVNGTTAVSHTNETIEVFKIIPDIELAATRLVCYAYVHRNDRGNQIEILPDGTTSINTVPLLVKQTLTLYERVSFMTA